MEVNLLRGEDRPFLHNPVMAKKRQRHNRLKRNDPCSCGSGRKYKNCHGAVSSVSNVVPDAKGINNLHKRLLASERLREKQQGKGKPIIAAKHAGFQYVAVGNMLLAGKWRTFHDFLFEYIRDTLGATWWNSELKKPLVKRHIILQWDYSIGKYLKGAIKNSGEVYGTNMTGAASAYMGLSYNLYLLAHNAELRDKFVERLKSPDQFRGAYYETFVSACFILAGFELSLEDESDITKKHCEFTATSKASGKKYSVEAKSRAPGKAHVDIGQQLSAALRKVANYPRVVFIDVNLPDDQENTPDRLLSDLLPRIKRMESTLKIEGKPAPPAFVFVTNHPYHYDLEGTGTKCAALGEGFKIPDFGYSTVFANLIDAFKSLKKHEDMVTVINAFREYSIPPTFDGEIPEYSFDRAERRFIIGEHYDISTFEPGAVGKLTTGTVSEDGRNAHLVFQTSDGRSVIMKAELTDAEVSAYRQHPETFFGVHLKQSITAETPLDLFEFIYNSYKETPKEKILEFMLGASDIDKLKNLPHQELLLIYCDRLVSNVMANNNTNKSGRA